MFKQVGLIGLGLIGGSMAKALKERTSVKKIVAMSRDTTSLEKAKQDGVIDCYSTNDYTIFKACDLIFICVPVELIAMYVENLLPFIKKECILTDVGSTKGKLIHALSPAADALFIGGHPMAGSEKSGYAAATVSLFENAFYILTPKKDCPPEPVSQLASLVKTIGALPIVMDYDYHDKVVAAISHLPHVVAALLVHLVKESDDKDATMHTLSAGGFKDITRIASSDPSVWQQICSENKTELLHSIALFESMLVDFKHALSNNKANDLYSFFETAKEYRDSFAPSRTSSFIPIYALYLDIVDRPGVIAEIATVLSQHRINIKNIGIVNNRESFGGVLHIIFDNAMEKLKALTTLRELQYDIYE